MKKAIVYCRVSTASQEDGSSLKSQADHGAAHAEKLGFIVTRTVKEVFSGAYLFDRPRLNEIRDEVRRGQVDAVIVYAVDRLSRNVAHLHIIKEEFERYNVELLFVTENFDNTAEGKLLQSVRGYVAEVEREKIKERTMRGRRTKVLNGTISHKRPLYGYRITDDGKREHCPETSHIVREMFARVLGGDSLRSVASDLTNRGIPTPALSTQWFANSISVILKNPAYAGKVAMFRYKHHHSMKNGQRSQTCKITPQDEWITIDNGNTPALVTLQEYDAVQLILERNKKAKRGNAKVEALLRGMVRCALCGRLMSPQTAKTYKAYVCTSKQSPSTNCGVRMLGAVKAEGAVWETIAGFVREPNALSQIIEEDNATRHERISSLDSDLADVDKRIAKLNSEINNVITRSADADERHWATYQKLLNDKQADLDRQNGLRDDILREQHAAPAMSQDITDILDLSARTIDSMSFEDRVKLLTALGLQVKWDGNALKASIHTHYGCQSNSNGLNNKTVISIEV